MPYREARSERQVRPPSRLDDHAGGEPRAVASPVVGRAATGTIESYEWKDGRTVTWRGRVRAYGRQHRIDFGTNHEGWNEERAGVEMERIVGQIERGTWEPVRPEEITQTDRDRETVHVTVSRWWQTRERTLAPNTIADYRWRINHILRHLARRRTAELEVRDVDEFREVLLRTPKQGKGRKGTLSPRSVNMTLDVLAQALDDAVDYGILGVNPARGPRRRLRVPRPARSILEPAMVEEMIEAAGAWEADLPQHQRYGRRSLVALLFLGGPRISEALLADRGDFDLTADRWRIPAAKTPAGARDVELPMRLAEELREHVAATARVKPDGPMWQSRTGKPLNPSNIRTRLLAHLTEELNTARAKSGEQRLPPKVTPHTLRRTYASLALLAGWPPPFVMAQMGHTDARLTLSVYAQVVNRQRVDRSLVWSLMRFADEPEKPPARGRNEPGSETTEGSGAVRRS